MDRPENGISPSASPETIPPRRINCSLANVANASLGLCAKLPERQRSVFMLSHYEGCTSREVSALTGLNESTVRVHLFSAIRKLRTLLVEGHAAETKVEKRRVHS